MPLISASWFSHAFVFDVPLMSASWFSRIFAIVIVVLVILPSFTAVILRLALYSHLTHLHKRVKRLIREEKSSKMLQEKLEEEPEMIKKLIDRFKKASGVLEQVNTSALIDQVYSQEKVWFFFCEQIDSFCRILPNLLLAFGLFGTFLGLTINLSALSQTLSQTNASDIGTLIPELQKPLEGMSIAFIASLVGIGCGTGLTFFNFKVNTILVKFQLISSLEDYLDNIYQPTVEGHSRLDKAVEKMVSKFSDFLSRFGETVREAVESSLRENIQKITETNIEANKIATDIYTQLSNTSGTLARGADIFQESTEVIRRTQFPEKLTAITEGLFDVQRDFSHSSILLYKSTESTETATKVLNNCVNETLQQNKQIAQVLELTQANQQSLSEIIPQLHEGAKVFRPVIEALGELQDRIVTKAANLDGIQVELAQLVKAIKNHTSQVSIDIQALPSQLTKSIAAQTTTEIYQPQSAISETKPAIENSSDYQNNFQKGLEDSINIRQTNTNKKSSNRNSDIPHKKVK